MERVQKQRVSKSSKRDKNIEKQPLTGPESDQTIVQDIDDLLDAIDEVLESSALIVKDYIQIGGE